MRLPRFGRTWLIAVVVLAVCRSAGAIPPWQVLLPIKRVAADPLASYTLTDTNGPWMILASSFAGEGADREAHELVLELRSKFNVPAYVHKKKFDYSGPEQGIGLNKYGNPKQMRYAHGGVIEEIAVLVGDFPAIDDPDVEKTLEKIKYAQPKCLELTPGKPTTRRYAGLRELQRRFNGDRSKQAKGPMGNAFVTRNPLLPQEYFEQGGLDKFVVDMNQGVEHSLLECPGKYTVRVASFRGADTIDQQEIWEAKRGAKLGSRLEEAALKANRVTEALRAQGIEAYEFHDRHESIVTVGSFDSIGTPGPNGQIELAPAVHRIMQAYGATQTAIPGGGASGMQPKKVAGVFLDIQPMIVQVPRAAPPVYARGPGSLFR